MKKLRKPFDQSFTYSNLVYFLLNNQLKEVQHPKSITIRRKLTTKAIKNSMEELSQLTDKQTLKSELVPNPYQAVWNVIGRFSLTNPFSKVSKKQT